MTTTHKVRTNVYLDADIKAKAQAIFKQYGIGLSDAFNMFLSQSVLEKGIPFEIKIPNQETIEAIEDVRNSRNMETISFEKMQEDMKKCISD